jgi:outer membrane protein assembly factor BamB
VYVGSIIGTIYALNASTGVELWSYAATNGVYSAPAVANGVVYASAYDSSVYALNASTGALLWSNAGAGNGDNFSPAVANGVVYVGSGEGFVYALNASTGARLWSYIVGSVVGTSPAVADGVIYVGTDDGNMCAFGHAYSPARQGGRIGTPVAEDPSPRFQPQGVQAGRAEVSTHN